MRHSFLDSSQSIALLLVFGLDSDITTAPLRAARASFNRAAAWFANLTEAKQGRLAYEESVALGASHTTHAITRLAPRTRSPPHAPVKTRALQSVGLQLTLRRLRCYAAAAMGSASAFSHVSTSETVNKVRRACAATIRMRHAMQLHQGAHRQAPTPSSPRSPHSVRDIPMESEGTTRSASPTSRWKRSSCVALACRSTSATQASPSRPCFVEDSVWASPLPELPLKLALQRAATQRSKPNSPMERTPGARDGTDRWLNTINGMQLPDLPPLSTRRSSLNSPMPLDDEDRRLLAAAATGLDEVSAPALPVASISTRGRVHLSTKSLHRLIQQKSDFGDI